MKVLVLGATGFIGHPVATALVRAGYTVLGQTRSAEKAKELEKEEIFPVVADPADGKTYEDAIAAVDVVIDASASPDLEELNNTVFRTVLAVAQKTRPSGPPLTFIGTSGTWVHGSHLDDPYGSTSDRAPLVGSMPLTSWRPVFEQKVLAASEENKRSFVGHIVRPSLLYGRSGSLFAGVFAGAKEGEIRWAGSAETRLATIHTDDLAELYVLLAEKSYLVPSVIFDASNPVTENLDFLLHQLQKVSGAKKITYTKPSNAYEDALNSSSLVKPTLGKTLLGWQPKKQLLSEGIKQYYHAWLATQA